MIAKMLPQGDFRDWDAIEAWAGGIAEALQNATDGAVLGQLARDHGLT
jgi:hypothetical protein